MHLMIDLETLGTNVDCVVTQIGFCLFDLKGGMIPYANNLRPDPSEQIFEKKRTVTWDTFKWWMGQSNEARISMIKDASGPMEIILEQFIQEVDIYGGWHNIEGVWGHGPTFDISIMESLFKTYGMKCPWAYNKPRCTRTIFMLANSRYIPVSATVKHDAKEDAIAQARNVQLAYQSLGL